MSDYNNGTLQDPCLRLDYGFGEEWASVELGDGTGYVRLADYEKLASENAKLRNLLSYALISAGTEGRQFLDAYLQEEGMTLWQELRSLGIEMDA